MSRYHKVIFISCEGSRVPSHVASRALYMGLSHGLEPLCGISAMIGRHASSNEHGSYCTHTIILHDMVQFRFPALKCCIVLGLCETVSTLVMSDMIAW